MPPFIGFVGIAVLGIGIYVIADGSKAYLERHEAQRWLEVNAVVESSTVHSWRGAKGSHSYMPSVTYMYAIGEKRYRDDAIRFGPEVVDQVEAKETVDRFPPGRQTVAYVDPADHRRAVLDRSRVTGAVKWQIAVGLGALLCGVVFLAAARLVME